MARLFISYKREEQDYAFALRQWLIDVQGWADDEIFVDRTKLEAGDAWAEMIFAEAEAAEVMMFLASEASLHPDSFCYRELRRAKGVTLAVTIKGVSPDDKRMHRALPYGAAMRQIAALDQQPTEPFPFVSPADNTHSSVNLNRRQVESLGDTLRDLGVAPNSFLWEAKPEGPFPGLASLQEGDEAIFFGRDLEIRDGLREIEALKASVTERALLIQAPSGAGKSSFLRAGLWRRLRRHAGFTPLGIIRTVGGVLFNEEWGLIAELHRHPATSLNLAYHDLEQRVRADLTRVLFEIADADASPETGRRTLLIGIDQAEEIAALSKEELDELEALQNAVDAAIRLGTERAHEAEIRAFDEGRTRKEAAAAARAEKLDIRLILTVRDDSIDSVLKRLAEAGIDQEAVRTFRLHRMPPPRFKAVILGPSVAAKRAGYKIDIDDALADALSSAASESLGEVGDALPILALALQRMVKKRRTPDGRITLSPNDAGTFVRDAVADAARDATAAAKADEDAFRL